MKKRCSKCGETKSVKEFYKNRSSKDGLISACKICTRQGVKQYEQSEKYKQAQKRYKQSGRRKQAQKRYEQSERRKQARRQYRQSERFKQARRQYQQSERFKQAQKRYKQSERGRQVKRQYEQSERGRQAKKVNGAIRRTRKTQAGGSYTTDQWYNLCKFYNFHCLRCDKKFPFEKLTVDHIKPVSKGGPSFIWNTQPLCNKCNNSKHNQEIDYRKTLPLWIDRDGPVWTQDRLF